MAFGNNLRTITVLFATVFVHHAAAVGGEDFSNNLFSDLAPILALFGEQVAKQFMSQSMGWADNIIFAMAPLGIITAIVGAIRVSGPNWLKAVIGRARESKGAAEVELMSSTSNDVCELWNGQSIVRMMGSPPILEIIYLHDLSKIESHRLDDCGLFTLEEAERGKILQRSPGSRGFIESLCSSFLNTERPALDKFPEKGQESHWSPQKAPKIKRESPNIVLNLSDRKNKQELRWWALVGVVLQLGVLIFSGLITYFPSLQLQKGGRTPVGYAYPFTACGTVILIFGMLICSHVVEQRTVEDVLQIQSNKGHLFWLQRGGEVGDQQFDSFAMFAIGSRDSIRTSRLLELPTANSEHYPLDGLVRNLARLDRLRKRSKELVTNPTISPHHLIYKVIATAGCFISITGFIIQFIGFRGMHWSATIAQLVATMMMAGVRAWVRRDLSLRPKDQKLSLGHELDWIATRIVRDYKRLWPDMKNDDKQSFLDEDEDEDEDDGFWEENCWKWVILSGMSTDGYNIISLVPQVSDAHSVVTVRKRLGLLSNWSGPVSDLAVSVATVIEVVMNSLCSFSETTYLPAESMYWSVNCGANRTAEGKNEQIYLRLSRIGENGPWKADATEIEAVLSLWLYSVQKKEHSSTSLREQKGNEQLSPEADWLRHGDVAIRQDNLRFLGRCLPSSCRDLVWYMSSQASVISVVEEEPQLDVAENDRDFGGAEIISVDNHRVVGFRDSGDIRKTGLPTTSVAKSKRSMYERWMSEELLSGPSEIDDSETSSNQLAVFSGHELKLLFAQDLFSTFMWAIAKKMDIIDGETIVHSTELGRTSNPTGWKNFRLENSKLSVALQAFKKAKLGSFEDACLCMIPPLSRSKKLPDALPVIRHAQKMAEELEMVGRLEEAGEIYLSLFRVGGTFHLQHLFSLKTTAILSEFLALINNMVRGWKEQLRDFEVMDKVFDLESKLLDQVQSASQSQLEILSFLYQLQNRKGMIGLIGALPVKSDQTRDSSEWFNRCGFTPLHPVVLSERGPPQDGEWERGGTERYFQDLLEWTPLHYVATGKCQAVEGDVYQLAKQMNHDSKNLMGWTALHVAAQSGFVSAAWRILQEGGQLEAQGRDGMRPLHYAVKKSRRKMVEWLVGAGADIEAHDNSRMTPLHWAACSESKEVVDILINGGAKTKSRDNHGRMPLHYAAMAGRKKLLVELSDHEIIDAKDREGRTPLHLGAKAGKESIVRCLLKKHANIMAEDVKKNTALHLAARAGQNGVVQLLLKMGADIEAQTDTKSRALHEAVNSAHESVVELLIEKGADIEAQMSGGGTALHCATGIDNQAIMQLLLEKGAYTETRDFEEMTALHWAAWKGNKATLQLLLEKGANVNARDFEERTPLHWAVLKGDTAAVQLLCEKGADINAQTKLDVTALHEAVSGTNKAMMQLLLENGAEIKAQDSLERTPLHLATRSGSEAMLQLLLEKGADTEARDDRKRTALHYAAEENNQKAIQLLLETGADIDAQDIMGSTPLNVWRQKVEDEMSGLLNY